MQLYTPLEPVCHVRFPKYHPDARWCIRGLREFREHGPWLLETSARSERLESEYRAHIQRIGVLTARVAL